jgi:hypothetical protein
MSRIAKLYITVVIAAGMSCFLWGIAGWTCPDPGRFISYLAIALLASALKVHLPGITGTMSVNYVFILLSIMELSYPETVVLGCFAIVVQTGWRAPARTRWLHALFN